MADSVAPSMKYCKNCIHHDARNWRDEDTYECHHPDNLTGEISLVTGRAYTQEHPSNIRMDPARCGPEGKGHKTHEERLTEHYKKEPANPSLTLLTRLSKMKFDVDKL